MKQSVILLIAVFFSGNVVFASVPTPDEGMWFPKYLAQVINNMQERGSNLTANDIYSVNNSSIKDAIVNFGNFCTAEIVSQEGLLFTNHHCGYDAIAELSSTKNNYLDDGFWAKSNEEELAVEGLTATILVYMQEITEMVNKSSEPDRAMDSLVNFVERNTNYKAEISSVFEGAEHYLMVYEIFEDIRLVGTPPSAVGKFGGDTDNWIWPRHTGDFAVFRIYASPDNQPAPFAEENVPYRPRHHLPISIKGVDKEDFAMIMGFPGSTERYLTTDAIQTYVEGDYPQKVEILSERLRVMKRYMDKDEEVRINLASDYASLANGHKYFKGVIERTEATGFLSNKEAFEQEFSQWVNADPERRETYGELLENMETLYGNIGPVQKLNNYINYAGFAPQLANFAFNMYGMYNMLQADPEDNLDPMIEEINETKEEYFEKFYPKIDQDIMASMLRLIYNNFEEENRPDLFKSEKFLEMKDKRKRDRFANYARYVYKESILANRKELDKFLADPVLEELEEDPGFKYALSILNWYRSNAMQSQLYNARESQLLQQYIRAMREMNPDKAFYPDADFTLRLTYGQVLPYSSDEGEEYEFVTHHYDILAKEIPEDEEFHVPADLKQLLVNKDFGRYAEGDTLHINFITNTDITGGNSGSPVMNKDGHLIGIAFDGNWEAMISDLYFDESITRTISVDVRYVLFVIDKMANSQHIMSELEIVE